MRFLRAGFHGGEVSPLLEGRGDLPALGNACSRLRNSIPCAIGGAFQRPGTMYLGGVHDLEHPTRLLPFTFASGISYRMELGHNYMRFWKDDQLCVTPEIPPPVLVQTAPLTGTATLERWIANWGTTAAHMIAWAAAHPATTTSIPGQGAPVGTGGAYGKSIQRVRAWFVPVTTGNYVFRTQGIDDVGRMVLDPNPFGVGVAAVLELNQGLGAASLASVALEAGKSYRVEFWIGDYNPPCGGVFQFSINGGAFAAVTSSFLAADKEGAGTVPTDPDMPPGTGVLSASGEVLRLRSPWSATDAARCQYVQANDVVWFTGAVAWPQRVVRYGLQDWRAKDMPVLFPPLRDQNADTLKNITASALSGNVTLTASGDVFDPLDIGGYYEIAHRREVPFGELDLTAAGDSPAVRIVGKWEVFSYGKWTGTLELYQKRKGAPGAVDILRTWKSKEDMNIQAQGEVDGDQELFLRYAGTGSGGSPPRATVSALDAVIRGLVKITGVTSATVAQGVVMRAIHSVNPTIHWSEGAWSNRRGFPNAVTIYQQRLWFGGTKSQPQTVWASAVGRMDDFERTTLEDSSFSYQLASQQSNSIVSLVPQQGLLIMTTGDEWVMQGKSGPGSPITPTEVMVDPRSGVGSALVPPIKVGSVVVFIQQGERVLSEYSFDYQQQNYQALDLGELSEHLTKEKIIQIAYAQNPHSVIWAVTASGSLLSLTYKRASAVMAWAKHTTKHGRFESVCCTPGKNGHHEVAVSVQRRINGVKYRTIERYDPEHWLRLADVEETEVWEGDAPRADEDLICVADGAVSKVDPAGFTEVTGLGHLEGATVGLLLDGADEGTAIVTAGKVTLPRSARKAVVGLLESLELQPIHVDVQMDTGSSMGRKFRVPEMDLKFWRSGAGKYACDSFSDEFPIPFRGSEDVTGERVPLRSGQVKLPVASGFQDGVRVVLRNSSMLPLNVLSLVLQTEIHGK